MNENEYQIKDEKGRGIFKEMCHQQQWCKHIKDSVDPFAHWDLSYTSGSTKMIGEIKYRNYDSTTFPDWMLEVEKLVYLKDLQALMLSKGKQTTITYINHFRDEKTFIWNLDGLNLNDYEIKKEWHQKNDFDETKVLKDVIYIKASLAMFGNPYTNIFDKTPEEQALIDESQDIDLPF